MDILKALKQDHREVVAMFKKIKATKSLVARKKLFSEMAEALLSHAKAEEKLVYEPILRQIDDRAEVLEAYEEHHVAEILLAELNETSASEEQWLAKFQVLTENVKHHIEEEESDLFNEAKDVFPDKKIRERVGAQFEALKETLKSQSGKEGLVSAIPVPQTPMPKKGKKVSMDSHPAR